MREHEGSEVNIPTFLLYNLPPGSGKTVLTVAIKHILADASGTASSDENDGRFSKLCNVAMEEAANKILYVIDRNFAGLKKRNVFFDLARKTYPGCKFILIELDFNNEYMSRSVQHRVNLRRIANRKYEIYTYIADLSIEKKKMIVKSGVYSYRNTCVTENPEDCEIIRISDNSSVRERVIKVLDCVFGLEERKNLLKKFPVLAFTTQTNNICDSNSLNMEFKLKVNNEPIQVTFYEAFIVLTRETITYVKKNVSNLLSLLKQLQLEKHYVKINCNHFTRKRLFKIWDTKSYSYSITHGIVSYHLKKLSDEKKLKFYNSIPFNSIYNLTTLGVVSPCWIIFNSNCIGMLIDKIHFIGTTDSVSFNSSDLLFVQLNTHNTANNHSLIMLRQLAAALLVLKNTGEIDKSLFEYGGVVKSGKAIGNLDMNISGSALISSDLCIIPLNPKNRRGLLGKLIVTVEKRLDDIEDIPKINSEETESIIEPIEKKIGYCLKEPIILT